ncbi:MAG: exonuclease II Exo2 [Marteilia pararefringens]
MGVPRLVHYYRSKYPHLISDFDSTNSHYRQFDYLYVDFNFLIHKFTNSSEEDKKLTVGEACLKINDLLKELRHIIWICGVKKSIFISIDSSTPWTKVNQQKSRRLKKNLAANSAVNCDENSTSTVPKHNDKDQAADSDLFDSNCISPKTEFMNFVEEQLEAFIKDLIENDSMMKKLKIFFSSQDCPGEGEHKIMDFVRHLRQEPNYDPDSTHLFLSNDSDFLFLSVTLHLDNVFMMREIYQKESNCDNLTYELLDISFFLYNIYELLCKNVNEEFVREHFDELCDDLIFIHVFLGNDFVPHLPNFHIHSGSIEILIQIYFIAFNQFSDQSKCFLIDPECYRINLENFRIFLHHLAAYEKDYVDKMLVMNRGLNYNFNQQNYDKPNKDADSEIQKDWEDFFSAESGSNQADMSDAFDKSKENCESDVQKLKNFKQISPIIAESGPNYLFHEFISFSNAEATDYTFEYLRKYYYFNKFGFEDFLNVKDVCENYFEALQWIIDYYFLGQINWRFYYKSNHAPFVYDLLQNLPQVQSESKPDTNLSLAISLLDDDDINNKADSSHLPYHLEQDLPHSPLLQLLVITPECSRQLIPVDLQDLHRLQDFPKSVVFEQNEKIAEWEAVAIIEPIGYNNYEEFVIENNDNYLSLIESIKFGAILLYSANNFEFSLHNSFTESNSFCKKQLSWDSFTFNSDKRASRRYHRFSIEKLLKHDLSLAHLFSYEPCTFSKLIFKTNTNQGLNLEVLSYKYNGSQNKDSQINFMQFALNNISKTAVFNWPHLRLGIAEILCTNQGYTVKQSGFPNSQNDRQSNQKHQLSFKQYNSGKCSHLNLCRIATNSFQRITFVPKVPQVYQPLLLMRQLLVKRQNNITDDDIDDQVEESVTPMTYYVSNSLIPTPILNISTIDELIRTQQQRVCLDESDVCFSACFHEKERIFSIFHINQKLHYSSRNFHKLHQLYNNTTDGFISIQHFSYLSTIPLNITFLLLGSTKIYLSQLNSTLDFGMNILEQNYDHCFSSASDSAVRKKNPNLQPQITKLLAVPLVTLFAKFRPCLAGLHMANNLLLCDAGIEQQILDLMTELNILAQELVQGQLYKRFLNTFQHKLIDSVYSDDSNDMNSNHSIDKNLQFNEIGHDIKKIPILNICESDRYFGEHFSKLKLLLSLAKPVSSIIEFICIAKPKVL